MTEHSEQLKVGDQAVSGSWLIPPRVDAVLTLAHGAGAGIHHPFLKGLAHELALHQMASLRFNFLYMEKGSKRPDLPARAHAVIEAAVEAAATAFPDKPLFLSGKSFGGRMSSQWLAAHSDAAVKGIVFFGFPLHPPGKPATDRADHLKKISRPMLFLQGTRDEFATVHLLNSVIQHLPQATVEWFQGADHSFKAGKKNLLPDLAAATAQWLAKNLSPF